MAKLAAGSGRRLVSWGTIRMPDAAFAGWRKVAGGYLRVMPGMPVVVVIVPIAAVAILAVVLLLV